ncbi:MAG: hypothetical protein KJ804_10635 [Proteobacteria bacterium]|nr:hypothetical protein [Pseudomonadota bacterium]MBU1058759.1 hypothetical protein [Pseudomonadota bacterium]
MLIRSCFLLPLLVLIFLMAGCAGPKVATAPASSQAMLDPVRVKSADLVLTLIRIAEQGSEGTLIEDPGWREYVIEIENISTNDFTVQNVKLLNTDGRYVDSASTYQQIIAPPDVGAEVAGDVAGTVAGIAVGQIIPYGGILFSMLSNAASTSSVGEKANASRIFMSRVLKNVELAPAGKVEGSAFLPNITRPKTLVVDYTRESSLYRIEIPLPLSPQQP